MAGRLNNMNMNWLVPPPSRQGSRRSSSSSSSQRSPVRSSCGSCRTPSSRSRSRSRRSRSAAPSPNNINIRIRAIQALLRRLNVVQQNRNAAQRELNRLLRLRR